MINGKFLKFFPKALIGTKSFFFFPGKFTFMKKDHNNFSRKVSNISLGAIIIFMLTYKMSHLVKLVH